MVLGGLPKEVADGSSLEEEEEEEEHVQILRINS
jgi:hypothetical protein